MKRAAGLIFSIGGLWLATVTPIVSIVMEFTGMVFLIWSHPVFLIPHRKK